MILRRGITVLRHGHGVMAFEEKSRLKSLYDLTGLILIELLLRGNFIREIREDLIS